MTARDLFHEALKTGLVKEGWTVTHDPFKLNFGFTTAFVDLGAEKLLAAEKGTEKIAVEIKSFAGSSELYEFHTALGQFINYNSVLAKQEPDRILFLAVPQDTYETFFKYDLIAGIIQTFGLKIIVYNPRSEDVTEWIK